jgi:hypothetical protein
MDNERGAVYPLVITLCFLILIFFGYFTEIVLSKRQFVYMQEEQLKQIRLVQQGMERGIILTKDHREVFPVEYRLKLNEGMIHMKINPTGEDERQITVEAVTDKQHTKKAEVYYNVSQNSVEKWVEG